MPVEPATHPDTRGNAPDRSCADAEGGNRYPGSADYPPKPRYWRNGLGSGSGECPRCGAWWTGSNTCHCTACHCSFTSQSASDKHRAGSHERDTRHCLDPATVHNRKGERVLVDAGRDYPCWGFPAGDKWWGDEDGAA